MEDATKLAIEQHAETAYPKECCGVVIVFRGKERYVPCGNLAEDATRGFMLDPRDYASAEAMGEVLAIVHSHPNGPATPSQADRVMCEAWGLPWHIVTWPKKEWVTFFPEGYRAPLLGRKFYHGVVDCYQLVKDYYLEVLQIELPHFEREDNWWNKGQNLYVDNFEAAGFVRVDKPQKHDVFLIQVRSPVPNHAAIFIDPERNWIMHHLWDQLSRRDVYAEYWRKNTNMICRHKSLL